MKATGSAIQSGAAGVHSGRHADQCQKIDGYRAYVEVDGKPMRLGHDYGREQETTEQWVNKLVVVEDPRLKIVKYPPAIRKAIEAGKLMKGMTKRQVIISVGYPQTNENPKTGWALLALLVVELRPLLRLLVCQQSKQDRRPLEMKPCKGSKASNNRKTCRYDHGQFIRHGCRC